MSIIPDYARQGVELMRQLEGQAEVTAQYWSDGKRKEYYNRYISEYLKWLENYVYGGDGMRGMGLNELLDFVAQRVDEFEEIAESSISGDIVAPGFSTGHYGTEQIMVPTHTSEAEISEASESSAENVPTEMGPANLTERRKNWTIDYNLNGPGDFSVKNLREILNKRRNG